MGEWTLVGYALQVLVAGLVLTLLTWAAAERARMHHVGQDESGQRITTDSRRLGILRVLMNALRAIPRSHRLHLALGAVGGCV